MSYALGIDSGGTNIKAVRATPEGKPQMTTENFRDARRKFKSKYLRSLQELSVVLRGHLWEAKGVEWQRCSIWRSAEG